MSYRPFASKIKSEASRRVKTAITEFGSGEAALFPTAMEASILDHYRDIFPSPNEVLPAFPPPEQRTELEHKVFAYLQRLLQWESDMGQDRSSK